MAHQHDRHVNHAYDLRAKPHHNQWLVSTIGIDPEVLMEIAQGLC
jgi:hypothetical protein